MNRTSLCSMIAAGLFVYVTFCPHRSEAVSIASNPSSTASPAVSDDNSAHAILRSARALRVTGESGYGSQYRRAASLLARGGDIESAIDALGELLEFPETHLDRLESLRMRGQYLWQNRDIDGAIAELRLVEQLCPDHDSRVNAGSSFASSQLILAELLVARGNLDEALRVNETILDPHLRHIFNERTVQGAEARKIRILAKLSGNTFELDLPNVLVPNPDATRVTRSIQLLEYQDILIARQLETGLFDGKLIQRMRDAARLRERMLSAQTGERLWTSDAYFDELSTIWADNRMAINAEIMQIGFDLIEASSARQDHELRFEITLEAIALLENHQHSWLADTLLRSENEEIALASHARLSNRIQTAHATLWTGLQHAEQLGRPDLAEQALVRLIQLTDNEQRRAELVREYLNLIQNNN